MLGEKKLYKRSFESKLKNIYDIKIPNFITCTQENEVNKLAE